MSISSDGDGYIVPDDPSPPGDLCLRVYIPDDVLYIAAFFAQFYELTTWLAWQKDGTGKARKAAARWKSSYQITRYLFDMMRGVCDADIEPIYEDGESWKEIDDVLWWLKTVIEEIDDMLDDGKSVYEIKFILADKIAIMPGISVMIDNMSDMTEQERDDAIEDIDWSSVRADVYCESDDCWPDYILDYVSWLNCAADHIFDNLNELSNWIFDDLNDTADFIRDPQHLAPIASSAGGGGSGFGGDEPDCNLWTHTFNFEGGAMDWFAPDPDALYTNKAGQYSEGVGWVYDDVCEGSNRWSRAINIAIDFDETLITSIKLVYDYTGGTFNYNQYTLYLLTDIKNWHFLKWNYQMDDGTNLVASCDISDTTTRARVLMKTCYRNSENFDGSATVKKVTLSGEGVNPFI